MKRTSRVCAAGKSPMLPGDPPAWFNLSGCRMVVPRNLTSREGENGGLGIPVFRESGGLYQEGMKEQGEICPKWTPIGKTSEYWI